MTLRSGYTTRYNWRSTTRIVSIYGFNSVLRRVAQRDNVIVRRCYQMYTRSREHDYNDKTVGRKGRWILVYYLKYRVVYSNYVLFVPLLEILCYEMVVDKLC